MCECVTVGRQAFLFDNYYKRFFSFDFFFDSVKRDREQLFHISDFAVVGVPINKFVMCSFECDIVAIVCHEESITRYEVARQWAT